MILAAGRGTRMGRLTDTTPKPLLPLAGMPLIEYHVRALASAGFYDIVINVAWLGEQIVQTLGDGSRFGVDLAYSHEPEGALETAGGIAHALPLLGDDPFVVINADIWTDFPLHTLRDVWSPQPQRQDMAHLVMVANPDHNPDGDFGLTDDPQSTSSESPGTARLALIPSTKASESAENQRASGTQRYTYSGIGVYQPGLFETVQGRAALGPLLRDAIGNDQISAQVFGGYWWDVGTPERLMSAERFVRGASSPG